MFKRRERLPQEGLHRVNESCEIERIQFLDDELQTHHQASKLKWLQFGYVNVQQIDGQEKRQLQLLTKQNHLVN